jgi:hypothetical protein
MWDSQACGGSRGILRSAVWVEVMVLPSGSKTEMLGLAGRRFRLGAWMVRKWPVEPVSAMHVGDSNIEVGGVASDCGEETGTLGVKVAGASRVIGGRRLGGLTSITENARGGSVGPLS